mmetsp:Transcript_98494/g.254613  ORF Transcript_98494/g.254613 Transcript_98494/m.254613 type:complete len:484 (+) Transcript_98494:894-2345(+)
MLLCLLAHVLHRCGVPEQDVRHQHKWENQSDRRSPVRRRMVVDHRLQKLEDQDRQQHADRSEEMHRAVVSLLDDFGYVARQGHDQFSLREVDPRGLVVVQELANEARLQLCARLAGKGPVEEAGVVHAVGERDLEDDDAHDDIQGRPALVVKQEILLRRVEVQHGVHEVDVRDDLQAEEQVVQLRRHKMPDRVLADVGVLHVQLAVLDEEEERWDLMQARRRCRELFFEATCWEGIVVDDLDSALPQEAPQGGVLEALLLQRDPKLRGGVPVRVVYQGDLDALHALVRLEDDLAVGRLVDLTGPGGDVERGEADGGPVAQVTDTHDVQQGSGVTFATECHGGSELHDRHARIFRAGIWWWSVFIELLLGNLLDVPAVRLACRTRRRQERLRHRRKTPRLVAVAARLPSTSCGLNARPRRLDAAEGPRESFIILREQIRNSLAHDLRLIAGTLPRRLHQRGVRITRHRHNMSVHVGCVSAWSAS